MQKIQNFENFVSMLGKSGKLGNLIPGKFCHLEGNFDLQNKEMHNKLWEI